MTSTLSILDGSPFPSRIRRYAITRISKDRGGRARSRGGRPRIHPPRVPAPYYGYAFTVTVRALVTKVLVRDPKRALAAEAAQYASDHAIGIVESARKFDVKVSLVDGAWRKLFPGVSVPYATRSKLERAVDFMIARDCTTRKAAAVFGVDPYEVCALYNRRTGSRRQLVGESAPRLTLTELAKAGNREWHYIEFGERSTGRWP